jgi:hypothetical protein
VLEFHDVQHILLTRAPALTGRYEFLSFRTPAGGRAWLTGIRDKVHSAKRWVITIPRLLARRFACTQRLTLRCSKRWRTGKGLAATDPLPPLDPLHSGSSRSHKQSLVALII